MGRAGKKLESALSYFKIDVKDLICADFGCSIGGFVECLLEHGAQKVYAVDQGYGMLSWQLRNDERVFPIERTNAMHVILPEKMDLISIDVGWTRQEYIIPGAINNLKPGGIIVTLIKPHYEADRKLLVKAYLEPFGRQKTLERILTKLKTFPLEFKGLIESPLLGKKAKNTEYLAHFIVK
jgi:23S rRNA (cytidine1920-2'-O)/16S rRNA (cytidine1409-2'-O)-methyltransferase